MKTIEVYNQEQLDTISAVEDVLIVVKFGTWLVPAEVKKDYENSVQVVGEHHVLAWENSTVTARENSTVTAWENSTVTAWENSTVTARGNSTVTAWENSTVTARGNSTVTARGNSTVTAWENSQVLDRTCNGGKKIIIASDHARIVYDPKTVEEYLQAYGLASNGDLETVRLYKAVHKNNIRGEYMEGIYYSSWDHDFTYEIGKEVVADYFTTDPYEDCGHGIHMAYPEWCCLFGDDWDDTAILELEAVKADIVVPLGGCGKVRAPRAKVIREVPLEDCGIEGKILAKRLKLKGIK